MSHAAIAAVLARVDLSAGERLATLSLASFANSEQRAWPGNPAAAARAGLCRSRYLQAREQLVARRLLQLEDRGRGRGQATTMVMLFAQSGPWWDAEINAQLLEAVLSHSRTRGPARLLLGALAALAGGTGIVDDLSTDELCCAAGLANSTYRRARIALLASGEVELVDDGGGRGRTNRWRVIDPAAYGTEPAVASPRRRAPAPNARPLLSPVRAKRHPASENGEPGNGRREIAKGPILTGVSGGKGPILTGVSGGKRPILTGVSDGNPAETPPKTPPPNAHAGSEPLNPGIRNPPNPPQGGSVIIDETYVTERGRKRRRTVRVDFEAIRQGLALPTHHDRASWERVRALLRDAVGQSTFEIWLEPVELIAIDPGRALVLDAPDQISSWIGARFGRALTHCADQAGRHWRLASEPERRALVPQDRQLAATRTLRTDQKEAS